MDRGVRQASRQRFLRAVALLGAGLVWLGAPEVRAQTSTGAVLAAPCAACHGAGGASPGAIPAIDKLDAAAMAALLRQFRNAGSEATVMNRIARGYTDAEIDALAQHFATQRR